MTLFSLSLSIAYRMRSNRYFDAFQTTLGSIPAFHSNSKNLVPDYANLTVGDETCHDDPSDNSLAGEALLSTLLSMKI